MATLQLKMENGFFKNTVGPYLGSIESTHMVGNGWECRIDETGTVICESIRDYSDGEHSMRYVIQKNGFAKLTLKTPFGGVKTLKKGFVLPKGRQLTDGIIGLAGGYVDSRYAYFRDSVFQQFLLDHRISAVKHMDPNKTYSVRNALYGGGECSAYIQTDGTVQKESYDSGRTDHWEETCPGTCAYEGYETLKVTGATWVVHHQVQHEGDSHNCFHILYTLEEPTKLVGIPNIKEQEEKAAQLKEVGSRGFFSLKKLDTSLREIVPTLKANGDCEDPESLLIKSVYRHHWDMLELDNGSRIKFESSEEFERAREVLIGMKFNSYEELDEYLHREFPSARLPKWYVFVAYKSKTTEIQLKLYKDFGLRNWDDGSSPKWTATI